MQIERVQVDTAIDLSEHGKPFINPYNGCTIGCLFCYWLDFPGREGRIQIRKNIPQGLDQLLSDWDKSKLIYMGSYCDPFMETERERRLAQACLAVSGAATEYHLGNHRYRARIYYTLWAAEAAGAGV